MALVAGTFVHQPETTKEEVHHKKRPLRVLILTKKNSEYGHEVNFKSGLNNSADFLAKELHENLHIDTHFTTCEDGNSVDREVFQYKPTHVVLEAIWVTPTKLTEIQRLHPTVIFIVRVHSKVTFLSYEGNAIEWLKEFPEIPNVYVAFNAYETFRDFGIILPHNRLAWLPNIYKKIDQEKLSLVGKLVSFFKHKGADVKDHVLDVACFGAIRPMKDILLQAMAAMKYCNEHHLRLCFHINTGRVEQRGDSTLKNIRALFEGSRHDLVEHGWLSHAEFIRIISKIDLGMQVSLNESFNVVTADYVYNYKPIVVSSQVGWVAMECWVDHTIDSIVDGIGRVIGDVNLLKRNLEKLHSYNQVSLKEWHRFLLETEL